MSHSEFDHRHYVIFQYSEIINIDFDEVLETSIDTVRKSVDGTKTFVKYLLDEFEEEEDIEGKSQ